MENIHVKIPNILKSMEIIGKLSPILVKNLTEMPTGVLEDINVLFLGPRKQSSWSKLIKDWLDSISFFFQKT